MNIKIVVVVFKVEEMLTTKHIFGILGQASKKAVAHF